MKTTNLIIGALAAILSSCNPNETSVQEEPENNLSTWAQHEIKPEIPLKRAMVIAFDASGSMSAQIEQAKESLKTYIKSLPSDVEVGIVVFGREIFIGDVFKLSDIKHLSVQELSEKISTVYAGGGTPLAEAVTLSYNMLAEWEKHQEGYCEYHLVVVTDGAANDTELLSKRVNAILETSPVQIFTIGFRIDKDHSLNMPGKTRYVSADNIEELSKGFAQVLAEKEE